MVVLNITVGHRFEHLSDSLLQCPCGLESELVLYSRETDSVIAFIRGGLVKDQLGREDPFVDHLADLLDSTVLLIRPYVEDLVTNNRERCFERLEYG